MAFDELRAFPHDEASVLNRDVTERNFTAQRAVELVETLLNNSHLKVESAVAVLRGGLVRTRGSSMKSPAQLMEPRMRTALGDRIVQWGIEHKWWARDDEKCAKVAAFAKFVNGPCGLATLVGCGTDGKEVDEDEEKKKGKDDASTQSITCGDAGRDDLFEARKWITRKMVIETLKDFAKCVGLPGGVDMMEGVEFDEEGEIIHIEWGKKDLKGNLNTLGELMKSRMPRLQVLDLNGNEALAGT
jgi:hypothetical protein